MIAGAQTNLKAHLDREAVEETRITFLHNEDVARLTEQIAWVICTERRRRIFELIEEETEADRREHPVVDTAAP